MNYISTRGGETEERTSAYAIKTGIAKDGGLFIPETLPQFDEAFLRELVDLPYEVRAAKILSLYLTDYTYDELLADTSAAYASVRFPEGAAPIHRLSDMTVLELFHGPTSAFKDMALQLMPRLFVRAMRKCGESKTALILVATSGDTGKAALEGYRDVPGTAIEVYYPTDGVSVVQKRQMQTQLGKNVKVYGIRGNFDDAQTGVKRIFANAAMKEKLAEENIFLSSANSINWGRLVPQIVYYVSAYCDMVKAGTIAMGEPIGVTVPTGNFGNIFAGYLAKRSGLPIDKFVCASNQNRILTDFFETGVYDRNRTFYQSISPSMDILISSNLERLLSITLGAEKCAAYMKSLNECGRYEIAKDELDLIRRDFVGFYATEDDTRKTIKEVFENEKYLIDTHTAVAVYAAKRYMSANEAGKKMLTVSTASPYKFARDVAGALTKEQVPDGFAAIDVLESLTGTAAPAPLRTLINMEIRHKDVIATETMAESVLTFAETLR